MCCTLEVYMKAEIVRWSYRTGSWDPCKGSDEWTDTKIGMFVPDLRLFISPAYVGSGASFHILLGRFKDTQGLNFMPWDYDRDFLPRKDYEVLRTIELDDEVAKVMSMAALVTANLPEFKEAEYTLRLFLNSMGSTPTNVEAEKVPF
jgi:hypothetical protein